MTAATAFFPSKNPIEEEKKMKNDTKSNRHSFYAHGLVHALVHTTNKHREREKIKSGNALLVSTK